MAFESGRVDELVRSQSRLAAVRATQLLDSAPEEDFDSLTRLAKTTLGAAASFVSIVDVDRDFYKSQVGFPEPLATARELAGRTFCHYAIASPGALVIGDTHAEPLWKAVPTVASLGVRAYVGVPIVIDGEPIGSFCVIDGQPRDWTAADIEIVSQLSKSAGREIRLRAALEDAKAEGARMHALARRSEEVVAVIAHDLRSPLQAISLTAAILGRSDDITIQGHAHRMDLAVGSMRVLVDDLLTAESAAWGTVQRLQPVEAAKLLGDAAQTMAPIAGRAGVNVILQTVDAASTTVDYAQILRALCNVIGNAVKYCPGSTVSLSATSEANWVRLTVSDDGPGIPASDLPRVFERGFQAANGAALGEGAGLGLSIVRTLVDQNGGSVELSSVEGVGTTVSIALPR